MKNAERIMRGNVTARKQHHEFVPETRCSRCLLKKDVVAFFFDWRVASGRYCLCESCLDELKTSFPEKWFFTVIKEAVEIIKRFFAGRYVG